MSVVSGMQTHGRFTPRCGTELVDLYTQRLAVMVDGEVGDTISCEVAPGEIITARIMHREGSALMASTLTLALC